jgi:hypothetical protein
MKIGVMNSWLFVTMLATAGLSSGLVRAQGAAPEDASLDRARQVLQDIQLNRPPQNSGEIPFFYGARTGTNVTSAIRKAAGAVRDAKGDEAKSDAQKKLAEVLSKSYDDDMVGREHELKQIEERLAKLRDLLERRRAKKQEIIDLQTKVALNEAEGLGFYDSERPAKVHPLTVMLPETRIDASSGLIPVAPAPKAAPKAPKATPR